MNLNYLKEKQKKYLLKLLQKYKNTFDRTLGKYHTGSNYTIELKEDSKPFPIPKFHELTKKFID